MKVLYLTKYTRKGASSRMRSYQFHPFLESKGVVINSSALFNDRYLDELYGNMPISKMNIFLCYLKRMFLLFSSFKYKVLIIEKELFPYFPAIFERILSFFRIKYIVDYDDAIFHNYDLSNNRLIRYVLKGKIKRVMRFATIVVVGNSYLESYALNADIPEQKIL